MKHMADCLDIKINGISLFLDLFTTRILVLKGNQERLRIKFHRKIKNSGGVLSILIEIMKVKYYNPGGVA